MKRRKLIIRNPVSKAWKIGLQVSSVVLLLCFYALMSWLQHRKNPNDTTIPSFWQMGQALVAICSPDRLGDIRLWVDLKATMGRYFIGLFFGLLGSIFLGIKMGCFKHSENFFLVNLSFLTKIPSTAMLAVFFVLVGTNFNLFIVMIAFGVMPTLTQAIYQATKYDVPDETVYKCYTVGGSTMEVIEIIFWEILPKIIEAVRLQIGPAMVCLIAAEWMLAEVGFGYTLRKQSHLLNLAVVYNYILVLGFFGLVMDYALTLLRETACHWFTLQHNKENK